MSHHLADELANALDRYGFAGLPLGARRDLDAFVTELRARDVPSVLVDVLADPAQPDVARLRAFGRLAVLVEAARHRPTVRPAA